MGAGSRPHVSPEQGTQAAEEEDQEQAVDPFPLFELDLCFAWWNTGISLRTQKALEILEIDNQHALGLDLARQFILSEELAIREGLEADYGVDMRILGFSLSGVYQADFLEDPWDVSFRAGFVYARLDMDDVPGDFDRAFGFEAAARIWHPLSPVMEGLSATAEIAGRRLEFEFDKDPDVLDGDSKVGGLGARLLVGLSYRF